MSDPYDLEAARAICEAATDGPWVADTHGQFITVDGSVFLDRDSWRTPGTTRFIAAARTGWPAALDEIERQAALLDRCEALVEKWSTEHQEDLHQPLLRCPRYHFALELRDALHAREAP